MMRVLSGGQTGVDRAALRAARDLNVRTGGWCPRDRWAEDGVLSRKFGLRETPTRLPGVRTRRNVESADATVVLFRTSLSGGTALTAAHARRCGKPLLLLDVSRHRTSILVERLGTWLVQKRVRAVNFAGPRASEAPGLDRITRKIVRKALSERPGKSLRRK